jgi:chromosomal replication initiation ATPase DnaA
MAVLVQVPCPLCEGHGVVNVEDVGAWEGQQAALIMVDICCKHGVTMAEMQSPIRAKRIADARFEAMYLMREELHLGLKVIGHLLGGRDHSTIIHGIKIHRERLYQAAMLELA